MNLKTLKTESNRRSGGFTMLEMMIIVVIIGILAAMAVPTFFSSGPRIKARTEARNVLNLIRLARSHAISDGSQYGVYIDNANREYILFKDVTNPSTMTYEASDSTMTGPIDLPPDVTFNSTFSNNTVIFMSTGRASQTGDYTFGITDVGNLYTVSVLASTGRSKLQ